MRRFFVWLIVGGVCGALAFAWWARRVPPAVIAPPAAVAAPVVQPKAPVQEPKRVKQTQPKPKAPVQEPKPKRKPAPAAVRTPTQSPYSCETVRRWASMFSRETLEAMAKQYGVTPEQRRAALACLKH